MMRKPPKIDPPKNDREAYERLLSPDYYGYTKMAIGAMLGITKQAVSRWDTVPLKYVTQLSEATGIPKADLRPSDFG
jgi:hypothetical protein